VGHNHLIVLDSELTRSAEVPSGRLEQEVVDKLVATRLDHAGDNSGLGSRLGGRLAHELELDRADRLGSRRGRRGRAHVARRPSLDPDAESLLGPVVRGISSCLDLVRQFAELMTFLCSSAERVMRSLWVKKLDGFVFNRWRSRWLWHEAPSRTMSGNRVSYRSWTSRSIDQRNEIGSTGIYRSI